MSTSNKTVTLNTFLKWGIDSLKGYRTKNEKRITYTSFALCKTYAKYKYQSQNQLKNQNGIFKF